MKYSKELHDRVRQNLRMFDYPRFDDGDIDTLLDEIERLQAERRWIPVSEKLPEDYQSVLLYNGVNCQEMAGIHVASVPEWETDYGLYYHGEHYLNITHWMPLPEPPEAE